MKIEGAASHLILQPAGERGEVEEDARVRVVSLESAGTILQVRVIACVHHPPPPISLESAGIALQVKGKLNHSMIVSMRSAGTNSQTSN